MTGLDHFDDSGSDTVFRDVILLALAGFVAVVLLLLPHINPPEDPGEESFAPGNLIIEMRWPDHQDADVDLWVEGPDGQSVGYSNKGGPVFNLLRDDLGRKDDFTELNYEVSYSRGTPAGAYTINVHLYSNSSREYPIPVKVAVSLKPKTEDPVRRLLSKELELSRLGEELTVFRFELGENGRLVPGSVHDLPRALRKQKS